MSFLENAHFGAKGGHSHAPQNRQNNGIQLKGPILTPEVLTKQDDQSDGETTDGPMSTSGGRSNLKRDKPIRAMVGAMVIGPT